MLNPRIRAACATNRDAVESRLENYLLQNGISGVMANKVADGICDKIEKGGFVDHATGTLIDMAVGESSILGTEPRNTSTKQDESSAEQSKLVRQLAFRVATVS